MQIEIQTATLRIVEIPTGKFTVVGGDNPDAPVWVGTFSSRQIAMLAIREYKRVGGNEQRAPHPGVRRSLHDDAMELIARYEGRTESDYQMRVAALETALHAVLTLVETEYPERDHPDVLRAWHVLTAPKKPLL